MCPAHLLRTVPFIDDRCHFDTSSHSSGPDKGVDFDPFVTSRFKPGYLLWLRAVRGHPYIPINPKGRATARKAETIVEYRIQ